jgi:outer membrane biosynthesis protein TonB
MKKLTLTTALAMLAAPAFATMETHEHLGCVVIPVPNTNVWQRLDEGCEFALPSDVGGKSILLRSIAAALLADGEGPVDPPEEPTTPEEPPAEEEPPVDEPEPPVEEPPVAEPEDPAEPEAPEGPSDKDDH